MQAQRPELIQQLSSSVLSEVRETSNVRNVLGALASLPKVHTSKQRAQQQSESSMSRNTQGERRSISNAATSVAPSTSRSDAWEHDASVNHMPYSLTKPPARHNTELDIPSDQEEEEETDDREESEEDTSLSRPAPGSKRLGRRDPSYGKGRATAPSESESEDRSLSTREYSLTHPPGPGGNDELEIISDYSDEEEDENDVTVIHVPSAAPKPTLTRKTSKAKPDTASTCIDRNPSAGVPDQSFAAGEVPTAQARPKKKLLSPKRALTASTLTKKSPSEARASEDGRGCNVHRQCWGLFSGSE